MVRSNTNSASGLSYLNMSAATGVVASTRPARRAAPGRNERRTAA